MIGEGWDSACRIGGGWGCLHWRELPCRIGGGVGLPALQDWRGVGLLVILIV